MELVKLKSLTRWFGGHCAFAADSLALYNGTIGLLGPNGAGKSTLIKMLLGLLPPSGGSAWVLGYNVTRDAPRLRARVGYVSEHEALVPGLSSVEYVRLAGELSGLSWRDAHRRAHEALAFTGVEAERYRKVDELSAGMKQQVQLAQALVHDPELLILDEPTSSLDPGGRERMLQLIRELHFKLGKSVVLSTHLLPDVERVCDSVVILNEGQVIASGAMDALLQREQRAYRLRYQGATDAFRKRLQERGVIIQQTRERGGGEESRVRVPDGFGPADFYRAALGLQSPSDQARSHQAASDVAFTLWDVLPEEESLDDVFHRLLSSANPVAPPVSSDGVSSGTAAPYPRATAPAGEEGGGS